MKFTLVKSCLHAPVLWLSRMASVTLGRSYDLAETLRGDVGRGEQALLTCRLGEGGAGQKRSWETEHLLPTPWSAMLPPFPNCNTMAPFYSLKLTTCFQEPFPLVLTVELCGRSWRLYLHFADGAKCWETPQPSPQGENTLEPASSPLVFSGSFLGGPW